MHNFFTFVLAAVLCAAAAWTWLSDDSCALPEGNAFASSPTNKIAAPATPAATAPSERRAAAQPEAATCTLTGRVVDRAHRPLAGARVAVPGHAAAKTDARGLFSLAGVAATTDTTIRTNLHGYGTAVRNVTLWARPVIEVGDIVLDREAKIVGTVVDEHGATLPGVAIDVDRGAATATSDSGGSFELAGLPAGHHILRASTEGFATASAELDLAAADTSATVELRLLRARQLQGVVRDRHAAPVSQAKVSITFGAKRSKTTYEATTDAAGHFTVSNVPRAVGHLEVTHPNYLTFRRRVGGGAPQQVPVTLTRGRFVSGHVVDRDTGEAIQVREVQLLGSQDGADGRWQLLATQSVAPGAPIGEFRIPLGIHTTARIVVLSDSHEPATSEPFWMRRTDVGPLRLVATRGSCRPRGVVHDERGAPIPATDVRITPVGELRNGAVWSHAETDANGQFESSPLPPGRYRMTVQRPGYRTAVQTIEIGVAESEGLHVELPSVGAVRGTVASSDRKQGRARVVAVPLDADGTRRPANGRQRHKSARVLDGRFLLPSLAPGHYELEVRDLRRNEVVATHPVRIEVRRAQESFVELELPLAVDARK